jgi:hypothetical protein
MTKSTARKSKSPDGRRVAKLGVGGQDRMERMMSRQRATFQRCTGCIDPIWCAGFRPVVGGPAVSPDCVWRERLMSRLETWWYENPTDAIAVVPIGSVSASPPPADAPLPDAEEDGVCQLHEPVEPHVRALHAGMRTGPDGRAYFLNYADRATEICGLDPSSHTNTFLELASLARGYACQRDCLEVAQSLSRLARVGLEPLAR